MVAITLATTGCAVTPVHTTPVTMATTTTLINMTTRPLVTVAMETSTTMITMGISSITITRKIEPPPRLTM